MSYPAAPNTQVIKLENLFSCGALEAESKEGSPNHKENNGTFEHMAR